MTSTLTPAESARLSAALREQRRRNPRTQMPDHYRAIVPESVFRTLAGCGRKRYAAIVYVGHVSLRWKGWKGKKKRGGVEHGVMATRRFMKAEFGYSEKLTRTALQVLRDLRLIELSAGASYSGQASKGDAWRPLWMYEKAGGRAAWLYWGPLNSESFLALDVVSQAIFILLHLRWFRRQNRIVCRPGDLAEFGVSRKIVSRHLSRLRHAGLLEHVDGHTYMFPWFVNRKEINMNRCAKKLVSLKDPTDVPKRSQEEKSAAPENVPKRSQENALIASLKDPNHAVAIPCAAGPGLSIFVARDRKRIGAQQGGSTNSRWLPAWHQGVERQCSHG